MESPESGQTSSGGKGYRAWKPSLPGIFRARPKAKLLSRNNLIAGLLLLLIFLVGFSVRMTPARFNELQALDPFYVYRLTQYMVDNNLQLPENDIVRHHPFGSIPLDDEYSVPLYLPAAMHALFTPNMPFLYFAIAYPALMGALAAVVMFFIGRELYDTKSGLMAAFFLATIPAFITRTSAGFFDKEPTFGFFMLVAIFFFTASFKRNSLKLGIAAGIFLGIAEMSSGMGRYMYIFLVLFAVAVLIINKHKNLLRSYVPTVIVSTLVQLAAPKANFDSSLVYIFIGIMIPLAMREFVERYGLVKEKDLKYVTPGILAISAICVAVASMFSDMVYQLVNGLVSVAAVQNLSPIGYTVAEQQAGNFGSMFSVSGLQFAGQIIPQLSFLYPYFAIWVFAFLGVMGMLYRIMKRRDFTLLFPLLWFVASIWGVFLFIRLTFLFGPPASLLAGLFVGWAINKAMRLRSADIKWIKPFSGHILLIPIAIVGIVVVLNTANAYAYSNNLGPSICIANPEILIDGERCLDINEDGSITFASGQPWYELMGFLRSLEPPKNILTWWDFGHWFNSRGETPSVSDGGKGPRSETALWYTATTDRWNEFLPWMNDKYKVTHIIQDYTLIGKYGAITAIATEGKGTVGFQQFQQGQSFQRDNTTIQEFTSGNIAVWLPVTQGGTIAGPAMILVGGGGSYGNVYYINEICSAGGRVLLGDKSPSVPGCLILSNSGIYLSSAQIEYYISVIQGLDGIERLAKVSQDTSNNIFVSLQFMQGSGLPVKKVFDNGFSQVYEVNYTNG